MPSSLHHCTAHRTASQVNSCLLMKVDRPTAAMIQRRGANSLGWVPHTDRHAAESPVSVSSPAASPSVQPRPPRMPIISSTRSQLEQYRRSAPSTPLLEDKYARMASYHANCGNSPVGQEQAYEAFRSITGTTKDPLERRSRLSELQELAQNNGIRQTKLAAEEHSRQLMHMQGAAAAVVATHNNPAFLQPTGLTSPGMHLTNDLSPLQGAGNQVRT